MNNKEYEIAKREVRSLEKKLTKLKDKILKHENEFERPVFETVREITNFIMYMPADKGALFEYGGDTYEVGDYEELIDEYGSESVTDGMSSSSITIEDLKGSYGIIELVKQ
jgi:hypothetical protein